MGNISNFSIITVICINEQIHRLNLCNLVLIDVMFPTTTVQLLLYMLSLGNNKVSFIQCFTQMYFFMAAAITEAVLLVTMAYDRYIAICKPLHYRNVFSRRNCTKFILISWTVTFVNSVELTSIASLMSFCHSNIIKQYFLISVILRIKSKEGRQKAFSTCSSHLTIIFIYYGSSALDLLMSSTEYFLFQAQLNTTLYANIPPMFNPLIYSLRSEELKQGLKKIFRLLGFLN
uniref:G-protein coupled receptors family 1 profile domain-containing protein n=1 Tax=Pyxicephalus adspersus TaxID=30357 RepID=A0AAV3ABA2_PYXAD|nr:TPA: hypothetical protein GDO54_015015 [Pyxicephalus adspersus]